MIRDERSASWLERDRWEVFILRECTLEGDTADLLGRLVELRSLPREPSPSKLASRGDVLQ